jgi:hypothetical protein
MAEGKYSLAASEALDSKWAKQVGKRSKDIAHMLEFGNNLVTHNLITKRFTIVNHKFSIALVPLLKTVIRRCDMDELNQLDYSEWLHWCGYTDAEMYSWPLDNDPAYMAGFAEGYAQIQMEGSYENFTS